MPRQRIAAAGGVVWRGPHSRAEVAVVHRPRYGDWSLPKGKANSHESLIATAIREVGEEIGAVALPSRRLGNVRYDVEGDRKDVTFWAMHYRSGTFTPGDEVDELEWLTVPKARQRVSYETDRNILNEFAALPPADSVVLLVRHAKAGKRVDWNGPDDKRPLDVAGLKQAAAIVEFLSCFGVDRVVSAPLTRCVQTVEQYAASAGVEVEVDPFFGDEAFVRSPLATQTALLSLAKPGHVTAVCSQGVTIPSLIDRLTGGVVESDTKKGAAWVLSLVDGDVVSADHYDDSAELP